MSDKPTTKDLILDAAETVVAREGARHMTIEAVAAEAGISKGGVLYHYPNKMALLEAMVTRMVTGVRDDINRAEAEAKTRGLPVLPHVIETLFYRDAPKEQVGNAVLAASAEQPHLLEVAGTVLAKEFQRLTEESPDPVLAQIALLTLDGLKLTALLGLNHVFDNQIDAIMDRVIAMTREMYQ
jgi:AcrR family transcriptional regulator